MLTSKQKRYGWVWLIAVVVLSAVYIAPRAHELSGASSTIASAYAMPLMVAFAASSATYIFSALVVMGSSVRPLRFGRTLLVQLAATAANRITPKGLGGAAITEQYLEHCGVKRTDAIAALTYVYTSGLLTHILLIVVLLLRGSRAGLLDAVRFGWIDWLLPIVVVVGLAGLVNRDVRRIVARSVISLKNGFTERMSNPLAMLLLLGGSIGVSLSYAAALYYSLIAFGANVQPAEALFLYLLVTAIGTAAPTPAGLGATDAAAIVGLSAMNVPIDIALSAMFTYRLITFWLPILPGLLALRLVSRWNHLFR